MNGWQIFNHTVWLFCILCVGSVLLGECKYCSSSDEQTDIIHSSVWSFWQDLKTAVHFRLFGAIHYDDKICLSSQASPVLFILCWTSVLLHVHTWTMCEYYPSAISAIKKSRYPTIPTQVLRPGTATVLYMGRFDWEHICECEPTSSLAWFRMNLKPGMRFWLHTTPTSSECLQSDTPKPLDSHWARLFSPPVQCTLSSQIRPGTERGNNTRKWTRTLTEMKVS